MIEDGFNETLALAAIDGLGHDFYVYILLKQHQASPDDMSTKPWPSGGRDEGLFLFRNLSLIVRDAITCVTPPKPGLLLLSRHQALPGEEIWQRGSAPFPLYLVSRSISWPTSGHGTRHTVKLLTFSFGTIIL